MFKKENRSSISSMYNIRCYLDLEIGKTSVRKIPYAYNFFIEQLKLPLNKNEKVCTKERYDVNMTCL